MGAQMWGEEARDRGEGGRRCGESKQERGRRA